MIPLPSSSSSCCCVCGFGPFSQTCSQGPHDIHETTATHFQKLTHTRNIQGVPQHHLQFGLDREDVFVGNIPSRRRVSQSIFLFQINFRELFFRDALVQVSVGGCHESGLVYGAGVAGGYVGDEGVHVSLAHGLELRLGHRALGRRGSD